MLKYQAISYTRLSYTNDKDNESNSISNQKSLIREFVKKHSDIEIVSEKVDDGYTGVLFDRPAFQEMMEDIRAEKVNCIIVKDLSEITYRQENIYDKYCHLLAFVLLPSTITLIL